ncbi:MAG: FliH/SctL family protein [Fimbriimonas sp.]
MSNPAVAAAIFPSLGATQARPSRVTPGALSPFAAIAQPVPAPTRAVPTAKEIFVNVERLEIKPKPTNDVGPDPAEIERIKAEATTAGYAEGYAEGLERGVREGAEQGFEQGRREAFEAEMAQRQLILDAFANALQATVDGLNGELGAWLQSREEAMAGMAMDVVRRLVSHELETSRASALAITREALAEVSHAPHARIRLNPFDVPILDQHRAQILAASSSLRDIDLVEDASIMGGCRVETESGFIDASIDSRLVSLEDAWRNAA